MLDAENGRGGWSSWSSWSGSCWLLGPTRVPRCTRCGLLLPTVRREGENVRSASEGVRQGRREEGDERLCRSRKVRRGSVKLQA